MFSSLFSGRKKKPHPFHSESSAFTSSGKKEENEDAFRHIELDSGMGIYVVCDGLSGYRGRQASTFAVNDISERIQSLEEKIKKERDDKKILLHIQSAVAGTNAHLCAAGNATTVTGVVVAHKKAYLFHAGDSRAYGFYDDDQLVQLTAEHSVLREKIDRGIMTELEARLSRGRYPPTRFLGQGRIELETRVLPLEQLRFLLLVTDGVTDLVLDDEIAAMLQNSVDRDTLSDVPSQLVKRAEHPEAYTRRFMEHSPDYLPWIHEFLEPTENAMQYIELKIHLPPLPYDAQRAKIMAFCERNPEDAKALIDLVAEKLGAIDNATALLVDVKQPNVVMRYVASLHNDSSSPQRTYDLLRHLRKIGKGMHVPLFDHIKTDLDLYELLVRAREHGLVHSRTYKQQEMRL